MLVEEQKRDGLKLAEELVQEGVEVTAAFWLKTSEDGKWFQYFATPLVDGKGTKAAYRRLLPILQQIPQPFWVTPVEIKVIGVKDHLAKAVVELQQRFAGKYFGNYLESKLGRESIDGAYIYPAPICALGH